MTSEQRKDLTPHLKFGARFWIKGEAATLTGQQAHPPVFYFERDNALPIDNYEVYSLMEILGLQVANQFSLLAPPGAVAHQCHWLRYTGLIEVYDYCECGAKRILDWREL